MRTGFDGLAPSYTGNSEYRVGFFNIKPGERAIVRFCIETENDFDIYTLHTTNRPDGKVMRVDCKRSLTDSLDKCPFCMGNVKLEQKCYLRLIRYYQNSDGTFTPKAQIWERNVRSSIVTDLRNYLNDYGDLTSIVCAITRSGNGLDTKYTVSPNLPNPEIYPVDWSDFADYTVAGSLVKEWSAQEMTDFLLTGEMPQKQDNPAVAQGNYADAPYQSYDATPAYAPYQATPSAEPIAVNYTEPAPEPVATPNFTEPTPLAQPTSAPAPAFRGALNTTPQFNNSASEASNRPRRIYN